MQKLLYLCEVEELRVTRNDPREPPRWKGSAQIRAQRAYIFDGAFSGSRMKRA